VSGTLWEAIATRIAEATGRPFRPEGHDPVGGGCINSAVRLRGAGGDWFVKLNDAGRLAMFEAEAEGLAEIARTGTVRVPEPVCWGVAEGQAFLVLEHLPLGGGDARAEALLGERLAALHAVTAPEGFGWRRDNTIGATPQPNAWMRDWVAFWRERRLGFQLALAERNGHGGRLTEKGARLLEALPALLEGHRPMPSLLHGDLWGGNWSALPDGEPVIYDPAVYYGDREADLAMTELFGGFGPRFHEAYRAAWPLEPGYGVRKVLYNLYHVLNHLNLFGGGYRPQAERMIERLLAEVR